MSQEQIPRSRMWRFDRTVRGVRLRSRAIYPTKQAAQEAEALAAAEFLNTGRISTEPPAQQVSESVLELYARWTRWLKQHRSPAHAYRVGNILERAAEVAPHFAAMPAVALTETQVEEWAELFIKTLAKRRKSNRRIRGRGEKTVNDWLRYSQTAFSPPWGRQRARRELPFNPFQYVDRYSTERKARFVPTKAQMDAVRLAAEGEFGLWLEVATETAARVNEALVLAWEDVREYQLVLYTRKSRGGHRVPRRLAIDDSLAASLKKWRARNPSSVLVFQRPGEHPAPRTITWARKNLLAACARADVPPFPPGSLRHYRASLWAAENVPLTTIQARLGHARATTTDNYLRELNSA